MAPGSLLALTGKTLYGTHWQTDMANALGVSKRAIRRWLAEGSVPKGVWQELASLLLERQAAISELLRTLQDPADRRP